MAQKETRMVYHFVFIQDLRFGWKVLTNFMILTIEKFQCLKLLFYICFFKRIIVVMKLNLGKVTFI